MHTTRHPTDEPTTSPPPAAAQPAVSAPAALAARLELAMCDSIAEYAAAAARLLPQHRPQFARFGRAVAFWMGPESPVTKATGLGMEGPVAAAELDEVERFFRERGSNPTLMLCPMADGSLVGLVGERGYRLGGFVATHVRVGLDGAGPRPAPGLDIRPVEPDHAGLFARTLALGFHDGAEPGPYFLDLAVPTALRPGARAYLAWADGGPVGGGAMGLVRDSWGTVAYLFGSSTLPHARGRGVHAALLARRLADAAELGCDTAVIQCRPGAASERNIARAGFVPAYTGVLVSRAPPAAAQPVAGARA